ncbi:sulfotransferase 2B1-like [Bombina bombina]|uniref:sulfotransferase 2B1-like n=1 Tax=Bombina bombina TaxID=8345 RepID=UPI00235A6D6D|nr:sulfotransferase 2B1-like [Bombina bombina]
MSEVYFTYKGTLYPVMSTTQKDIDFAENKFQVYDDDIFNITFPKSGTTWMMEILSLIKTNGDPTWIKTVPNWDRVPWIEAPGVGEKLQTANGNPRLITSHLGRHIFCKSFSSSNAKVIYTIRNPKDVLVSFYHFARMSAFFKDPESFDQFINDFLSGNVGYGSWFDHVKGWMEFAGKENFMLHSYEDMQKDLRGSIKKIAKFIGKELEEETLESIVQNVTFENMKENCMANFSLLPDLYMDQKKSPFMRKGISGDWKNHFTVAQNEYFDQIYKEKMKDFNMKFVWDEN